MCLVKPMEVKTRVNRTTRQQEQTLLSERHKCVVCGKDEAHDYCTGCHHWFHGHSNKLPENEQKLIAIPTDKRLVDGNIKYIFAQNTCAHIWHSKAREKLTENATKRTLPKIIHKPFSAGAPVISQQASSDQQNVTPHS